MSPGIVGDYHRSRDGKVIHWAPCPSMGSAVPWKYADGKTLHEVAGEVAALSWLRLCRRCWPADAVSAAEAEL